MTGYHLCGVGGAGFIFVASARVWGKRHLYLLGTVLIIVSSAWGGASRHNYKSILGARIVQGVGLAPFEALVNASVGDLYFVHVRKLQCTSFRSYLMVGQERGKRMALSNLCLFGSAFFTPIVVGKITHTLGWQWSFYLIAIFAGAVLPFIFFFVPETAFRRPDHLNTDITGEEKLLHESRRGPVVETPSAAPHTLGSLNGSEPDSVEKQHDDADVSHLTSQDDVPTKVSFARKLLPFNGRKTDDNMLKLILRPLPLFFHPAILWACLIQGTLIGWTVMIGVVLAAIFLGPPLFFNEVKTGYMYTSAFIGALLGFFLAGLLSDWSTKWMIRRNQGVYEPEFRIVLVAAQLVCGCVGLYGFGITAANIEKYHWFLPDFFFAWEVMGMVIGAVASALYIVDAHRR